MNDSGKFFGPLVYFASFLYILWSYGVFVVTWYILPVSIHGTKTNVARQ
jgi:hypothetical protein